MTATQHSLNRIQLEPFDEASKQNLCSGKDEIRSLEFYEPTEVSGLKVCTTRGKMRLFDSVLYHRKTTELDLALRRQHGNVDMH